MADEESTAEQLARRFAGHHPDTFRRLWFTDDRRHAHDVAGSWSNPKHHLYLYALWANGYVQTEYHRERIVKDIDNALKWIWLTGDLIQKLQLLRLRSFVQTAYLGMKWVEGWEHSEPDDD